MHRLARAYGTAVQFSVFLCCLARVDRERLAAAITETIDHKRDRVILVDLGEEGPSTWIASFEIFGRQQIERPRKHVVI
jgi:CRISPR/Cas system-associated endoribonuclease Cas2